MDKGDVRENQAAEVRAKRVQAVIADVLRRRRAGDTAATDEAVLAAHPDLLSELTAALSKLRLIQQAGQAADDARDSAGASRGLHIRCPHCHNPIEVVERDSFSSVNCPTCGSNFSLITGDTTHTHHGKAQRVAHFELLDQVGQGAFGVVWKARDTVLQRTVALKIPRRGQFTPEEAEFFFRDARAAAQLNHPGIVSVHEVGREGNTLYIASEFIEGATLAEWIEAHPLTPREAAQLLVQVTEAIQHAHERGVIHRDLKPGNILLDMQGQPHVADFGLAKRDAGEITMTVDGQVLGTPAYMSPEQARGHGHQADARSDVYSLGVILFELLTGELPFRGSKAMLVVQILKDEPPSLRKLSARVPRDLETICLKAMAKEPERRYGAAKDLAADLKRYVEGQPILARPVGRVERTWRWCKRNPVVAGLLAAVILSLATGTVVSTVFAMRANERAAEAVAEWERAEANAQKALAAAAAESEAKETAETRESETKAVLDFVENKVFAAARPKGQKGGLGYDVRLRDAIESALPFVEASFTNEPLIEARLRITLGASFSYLGDAKIAAEQYAEARRLYSHHRGEDHANTLASMSNLANSYQDLGRQDEALKLREETLALRKVKLGPNHPDTLSSMSSLSNSYQALGRHDEALKLREETLALRKAKLGPDHPNTLASMINLASSYDALGRYGEALKLREETLPLVKAKLGPDHTSTLASMNNLASSYDALGRYGEALKLREETLPLMKVKLGPDHPTTLLSMHALAYSYQDLGRHDDALKLREETLALRKVKLGPDHPDTLASMSSLSNSYQALGRHDEALKLREETLAIRKVKLGPDHPDTLASMNDLASSYQNLGRYGEALKLREETLALVKVKFAPDHPSTLVSMSNLANSYQVVGRHDEALKLREETLALRKVKLGPDHPDTIASMINLANSYQNFGRHDEALKLREETLALRKVKLGPDHPDTLVSMNNLANSYQDLGRHEEALKLREETLALRKVKLGPDHPDTLLAMESLAAGHRAAGQPERSDPLFHEVIALRLKKLSGDIPAEDWEHLRDRGNLHARAGQWQKGAADLAAAIQAHPEEHWLWFQSAGLWLMLDDAEAYRRYCRDMLDRFGETDDPMVAERTAKACLLTPDGVADVAVVVRLADRAVSGTENHQYYNYFLLACGLAHYRAGEFTRAVERLEKCVTPGNPTIACDGPAYLVLAMAQHRLGHAEQAAQALTKARETIDVATWPKIDSADLGESWHDVVMIDILRRETEALLTQPAEKPVK